MLNFQRILNLRPGEGRRVAILYVMFMVINAGLSWGRFTIESEFLKQAGVANLPWMLIASACFSVIAAAVYTALADTLRPDTLLIGILGLSALLPLSIVAVSGSLPGGVIYSLLYVLLFAGVELFNLHWAIYVNSFYDTQSSKRIFPLIASAARISAIIAGFSIAALNNLISTSLLLTVSFGLLLLAAGLAWLMPRLLGGAPAAPARTANPAARRPSFFDTMREGYRYVAQSAYLRWLAASTFVLMVMTALVTYQVNAVLNDLLPTSREISNLYGLINAVSNLAMLPFLFAFLSRIISTIGVGSANLIYPIGNLFFTAGLAGIPNIWSASLAYFSRNTFRLTFQFTLDSLLYNAVPLRVKGRARAFVGGVIAPIGMILGALFPLALPLLPESWDWFVPALLVVTSIAYLATAVVVRREYARALVTMLEQEDYSFLLAQNDTDLTATDPATLNVLRRRLEESGSPELTIFIAQLISQAGREHAVPILGPAVRQTDDPHVRSAILDALASTGARSAALQQLFEDVLSDPDPRVRLSAIIGLENLSGSADRRFLERALDLLNDPDLGVRAQVLPALLQSPAAEHQAAARQTLDTMLADEAPAERARAVAILGGIQDAAAIRRLTDYLDDPEDEVRLAAALTLESISAATPALLDAQSRATITRMAADPVERIRQAALVSANRLQLPDRPQLLIGALTDPGDQVRATAIETLIRMQAAAVPALRQAIGAGNPQLTRIATVVLGRIDRREFGEDLNRLIRDDLRSIYRDRLYQQALESFGGFRGVALLRHALHDHSKRLLDEVFEFLALVHGAASTRLIRDSLGSAQAHTRANAVEALDTLIGSQTTRLIAQLLDPEQKIEQIQALAHETWDLALPDGVTVLRTLITDRDSADRRALTAFALGELGAKPSAGDSNTTPAEPTPPTPSPRRRGSDLLGALGSNDEKPPDTPRRRGSDLLGALGSNDEKPPDAPRRRGSDLLGALGGNDEKPPDTPRRRGSDLLGALGGGERPREVNRPAPTGATIRPDEITALLNTLRQDADPAVCAAAEAAIRTLTDQPASLEMQERHMLSTIEKMIFLKEVPFFQAMTIDQLKVLANACDEQLFDRDTRIFNTGDPGGTLYVVVSGKVGIEQEKRKGSFARLATIEARSYFGEMNLFDSSQHTAAAIAIQDTLTLRLRREPLLALCRQYPDLSLKLIDVLSTRLRESNDRIADLTRTMPRELHKFFDRFE